MHPTVQPTNPFNTDAIIRAEWTSCAGPSGRLRRNAHTNRKSAYPVASTKPRKSERFWTSLIRALIREQGASRRKRFRLTKALSKTTDVERMYNKSKG